MPALSSDPVPYAEFIRRHLLQPVSPAGIGLGRGVAETEEPVDGDRWLWADDNAKVLEFLALPALCRRYPEELTEVFRFVQSLCEGPFIFRRTGHPRLERAAGDAAAGHYVHSLMNIVADLPRGVVTVGMRFHDGRTARNLILTGNYLQFTHEGVRHSLDVEEAIAGWHTEFAAPLLVLSHTSEIHFPHQGRQLRLGRLTYSYRFDARAMFFDAEATLELDPAVTVSDLVLTLAQDDLSHNDNAVRYGTIRADVPGRPPARLDATVAGHHSLPVAGAGYWSIAQSEEMLGFALAIHSVPREPRRLATIEAVVRGADELHYVIAHYRFPEPRTGGTVSAAERKIITSGGFYDRVADCSALFRRRAADRAGTGQPVDLSISYDYGAELAAFARCHRALSGPDLPLAALPLRAASRELFDHYYAVYHDNLLAAHAADPAAIFSRPLSFVGLGLIDMWRATREDRYRQALRQVVDVLLQFERPFPGLAGETESGFIMGQRTPWPFVDCHSAALLALIRALPVLDDASLAAPIDRALGAFQIATIAHDFGGARKADVVLIDCPHPNGGRARFDAFWNYSAGLTLRAFKALRRAAHPALREVAARHALRMDALGGLMERQIARSLRDRDDALEIRTSHLSAEGNSETQPWVALAVIEDSADD